ncbi:rhamnose transport system substrate-binding protein [Palleronia salina]|uniref:Rhamnose transport system substrate-binding protein n=2 Tax=Palleronia TaxID=315422 RepID=A0A1M6LWU6_9RHOB|nr:MULTISPECIES: autoinducer 2 ABC transporter substrate-binding protein [Palleronia]SEN05246.1 rhamnose transport system substrate-binding protein [Palleronia pelagia]SHJ75646.1 rhamnose transport system substrate-binding protein [Palleronia salina]
MSLTKSLSLGAALGLATAIPAAAQDDTTQIAFIPQIAGIPYYVAMEEGAQRAAEELGVEYVQEGPTSTNAADQLRIFESFVNQGFDVIAISPLDEETLKPAIARALEAGIVVLTSDADAPGSDRQFFVAQALDQDLGYTLLDEAVERIGESGKIAIVSDSPTIQSMQNWIAAIEERAAEAYPEIEIVSVDHTDGTAQRAYQFATDAMTRNPDLKAVLGMASTTCPGIAQAVEAAGLVGEVLTAGYCSPNTAREYIKSGAMPFSVLWNPAELGYLTVWVGDHLVDGGEITEDFEVDGLEQTIQYLPENDVILLGPPAVFTEENVDDFDF